MQAIKNYCFINQICEDLIKIIIFDETYKIVQYKLIELNGSKLHNIYCGIVHKVDYSIESLFVTLESNLSGFLSFKHLNDEYYDKASNKLKKNIKKGDKILVQVIRDSLDNKLLKLTNNISFSSQFCVYLPFDKNATGISTNIKANQRVLIKNFLNELKLNLKGSLIVRTAGAESDVNEIKEDYFSLLKFYNDINLKFKKTAKSKILFKYDELVYILRSYSIFLLNSVFVKDKELYEKILNYNQNRLIKFPEIIFEKDFNFLNSLLQEEENLYKKEIKLPSNGSVVFEKTEALISVDVNSNKGQKALNMEITAFNTNKEAAQVIIDQILLRNLGGIIVIDFIDMKNEEHINIINNMFKQGFRNDKSSVKILPINLLGVLQLSRERKGLSLLDKTFTKCRYCEFGYVKSIKYHCYCFFELISNYGVNDNLKIEINSEVFNYIFKHYFNVINKYKKLNWLIKEVEEIKISYNK